MIAKTLLVAVQIAQSHIVISVQNALFVLIISMLMSQRAVIYVKNVYKMLWTRGGSMRKHHRIPKIRGGSDGKQNVQNVKPKKHRAFHILFSTMTPHQIADELNKTWISRDLKLVCVQR